jgi:hypothetical protein
MTRENLNIVHCLGNVEFLFEQLDIQNQILSLNNKYYSADLYFTKIPNDQPQAVIYTLDSLEYPVECKDIEAEIKIVVGRRECQDLYLKCLEDGFEYISWTGEEGGKTRILECLEAHTWPDRSPAKVKNQEIVELSETLFGVESFEKSISKFQELRTRMQEISPDERFQLAEQVALAFDLFLEEDEFGDFVHGNSQ